jgi:outer membrane protein OmpA-like peptidoglycan-associated protein
VKPKRTQIRLLAIATACYLTTSCASMNRMGAQHGTAIGCGVGAVLGGVLGNVVGRKTGNRAVATVAGAAVGTAFGCYIGNRWQKHQRALQDLAAREHMIIETEILATRPGKVSIDMQKEKAAPAGLVANIQSQGMFATSSDHFTDSGMRQARELAAIYRPDPDDRPAPGKPHPVLLVVGHTDATGPAAYNQRLSERRAHAMGQILASAGIDSRYVYFQGAGSSRPVADNGTEDGRARNRRVEIVELASADLLDQRIREERANPRYLAHGTAAPAHRHAASGSDKGKLAAVPRKPASSAPPAAGGGRETAHRPRGFIDFGGMPTNGTSWGLAKLIQPRRSGFSLISVAHASSLPLQSCETDRPRITGEVKNLASGTTVDAHATREFLPGMNGRAWAGLVNGNLVTLSPVSVLRDDARVVRNPKVFVTPAYSDGGRKVIANDAVVANTYEGESNVLYRVFVMNPRAPMKCMDVVMPKAGASAAGGELYYARGDATYVADFKPIRS